MTFEGELQFAIGNLVRSEGISCLNIRISRGSVIHTVIRIGERRGTIPTGTVGIRVTNTMRIPFGKIEWAGEFVRERRLEFKGGLCGPWDVRDGVCHDGGGECKSEKERGRELQERTDGTEGCHIAHTTGGNDRNATGCGRRGKTILERIVGEGGDVEKGEIYKFEAGRECCGLGEHTAGRGDEG